MARRSPSPRRRLSPSGERARRGCLVCVSGVPHGRPRAGALGGGGRGRGAKAKAACVVGVPPVLHLCTHAPRHRPSCSKDGAATRGRHLGSWAHGCAAHVAVGVWQLPQVPDQKVPEEDQHPRLAPRHLVGSCPVRAPVRTRASDLGVAPVAPAGGPASARPCAACLPRGTVDARVFVCRQFPWLSLGASPKLWPPRARRCSYFNINNDEEGDEDDE